MAVNKRIPSDFMNLRSCLDMDGISDGSGKNQKAGSNIESCSG